MNALLPSDLSELFPLFADLMLKSVIIIALASFVLCLWRGASAAQRHWVWTCAFGVLLLQPLALSIAPRWQWTPPATSELPEVKVSVEMDSARPVKGTAVPEDAKVTPVAHWTIPPWKSLVIGTWLAGAGLLITRRALGSLCLSIWRLRSLPVECEETKTLTRNVARECGVRRSFALLRSPACKVPLTWGHFRAVIMVPADFSDWPPERQAIALRHELSHMRRRDCLTRLVAQLACALYWPNPFLWFGVRALHLAQERACDDLVLAAGISREDYATELFEVAQRFQGRVSSLLSAAAMAQPSTLETRIVAIMDEARNRSRAGAGSKWLGVTLSLIALGAGAAAQARSSHVETISTQRDVSSPPEGGRSSQEEATFLTAEAQPSRGEDAPKADTLLIAQTASVPEPCIRLELELMEISPAWSKGLKLPTTQRVKAPSEHNQQADAFYRYTVLKEADFKSLNSTLTSHKGVDAIRPPAARFKPGQPVKFEIFREFRYPTKFEIIRDPIKLTTPGQNGLSNPTQWGDTKTGCMLSASAKFEADGAIRLKVTPRVVEFLGFFDNRTGKSRQGTPPSPRIAPVFSRKEITMTQTVRDGETLAISEMPEAIDTPVPLAVKTAATEAQFSRLIAGMKRAYPDWPYWIFVTVHLEEGRGEDSQKGNTVKLRRKMDGSLTPE